MSAGRSPRHPTGRDPRTSGGGPLPPAVPDRLVGSLVVGPTEGEGILRPDDRVAPVAAASGQDPADERQLLAAHEDVEGALDDGEEDLGSKPRRMPRRPPDRGRGWRSGGAVPWPVRHPDTRRCREDPRLRDRPGGRRGSSRRRRPSSRRRSRGRAGRGDPVAGLRRRFAGRRLEREVEVERLWPVAALADIEAPEELADCPIVET